MNEKIVMVVVLGTIMAFSIAGLINFNSSSGAATYDYRSCTCLISLKDNAGRIITDEPIKTQLRMQMGGMDCQAVCEHYYRGQEDRISVQGFPGSLYDV